MRDDRKTLPPAEAVPQTDVLSVVLRTVNLTGATFFCAEFQMPWGVTSPPVATLAAPLQDSDAHILLFHLVLAGTAQARAEQGADVVLKAGDIVAFPHGDAHRMWRGRPVRWLDTAPVVRRAFVGHFETARISGQGAATRFVCGYFACDRFVADVILAGLPAMLRVSVRDDDRRSWLEEAMIFLAAEAASDHAGRSALLTKLSEALFVETLRRWMASLPAEHTGWLAAARDEIVGRALAHLHRQPARPWSLDMLARAAGTSRSTLVERFVHYLDEPPMAYLARWRLRLAARLLTTSRRSVLEIAGQVGYESEAAFNRAFKREYGRPPGRYRRAAPTRASPARHR